MTFGQRRAHKIIWLVLAIVIPTIIFFSVKDLNIKSLEKNAVVEKIISNENFTTVFENDFINAAILGSQLEIILKSSLKNASSVVYEMNDQGEKSNAIGQLTSVGVYTFNLNNMSKGIILYDNIKDVEITKFLF